MGVLSNWLAHQTVNLMVVMTLGGSNPSAPTNDKETSKSKKI